MEGIYISDLGAWCEIEFAPNNLYDNPDGLYSNPLYYGADLYFNNELITALEIPNNITSIVGWAFYNCSKITSVIIPDGVTSIGDKAFYGCSNLTSVILGNDINHIGTDAFDACSNLVFNTYENCKYLGSATNPYFALIGYTTPNRLSYEIHDNTKIIANYAFNACTRLANIVIPNNVMYIGDYAFMDCNQMSYFAFDGSVAEWNSISFGVRYRYFCTAEIVICSDGNIPLEYYGGV